MKRQFYSNCILRVTLMLTICCLLCLGLSENAKAAKEIPAPDYLYIYSYDLTTLELDFPALDGYGYQIYRKAEGDSKFTRIRKSPSRIPGIFITVTRI